MILDINKFLLAPIILLGNRKMEYDLCMKLIKPKMGYCMEFGVWKGQSINYMAKVRSDITFYGFDSFEGLPENWEMGNKTIEKGHFKIEETIKTKKNVILVKGLFQDTIQEWKKEHKESIQFLNIDSDLYSSAKTILFALNDQILINTIIRFDELLDSPLDPYPLWQEGEFKALSEWCKTFNREVVPISRSWKQGCTVIVKK